MIIQYTIYSIQYTVYSIQYTRTIHHHSDFDPESSKMQNRKQWNYQE